MFYHGDIEGTLRFGDVLKGYISAYPIITGGNSPQVLFKNLESINISYTDYCAVLTPCCEFEKNKSSILITPILQIRQGFLGNPHLAEDLTRINRKMFPNQGLHPRAWENIPPEEQAQRMNAGLEYVLYNFFIYESDPIFPEYNINRNGEVITTKHHMIDFGKIFRVKIKYGSNRESPPLNKCLQLSITSRNELRDKLSHYFSRVPQEDIVD